MLRGLRKLYYLVILFFLFVLPGSLFALEIVSLSGIPEKGDIFLRPAKMEVGLKPGEGRVVFIEVLNRMGRDVRLNVGKEDFAPDLSYTGGVTLGETISGLQSSLVDYLSLPTGEFFLSHGQLIKIPVSIDIPQGAIPGGLYGTVLISVTPLNEGVGSTQVITRIGSLFFVKILGQVEESGRLRDFSFDGKNKSFKLIFENDGSIYLNPYGEIRIYDFYKNVFVDKISIDPWFVLPKSIRAREMLFGDLLSGKYLAKVDLNRGYNDIIDSKEIVFEISGQETGLVGQLLLSSLFVSGLAFFYKKFYT